MTDELTLEEVQKLLGKARARLYEASAHSPEPLAERIGNLLDEIDALPTSIARAHIEAKGGDVGALIHQLMDADRRAELNGMDGVNYRQAADALTAQQSDLGKAIDIIQRVRDLVFQFRDELPKQFPTKLLCHLADAFLTNMPEIGSDEDREAKGGDAGELVESLEAAAVRLDDVYAVGYSVDDLCRKAANTLTAQQSALAAKEAEIVRLKKALEWYAQYDIYSPQLDGVRTINVDRGQRARAALGKEEAKGGDVGELANKLRKHVIASDGSALYPGGLDGTRELILSAADALTVQQSELAALKGGDVGELAAFGASEAACIYYPGEDQELLRDAFCRGAGHTAFALAARDAEIAGLREALAIIKGGRFHGASTLSLSGNWKALFEMAQDTARAAIGEGGE